jgi:hypothetical protein
MLNHRLCRRAANVALALVMTGLFTGAGGSTVAIAIPPAAPPLPVVETSGPLGNLSEPGFIAGHDHGQSTLYDNGQGLRFSYWSFGDTVVDRASPLSDYGIGNTAARTTDLAMGDNVSSWAYDNTDADGFPHEAFPLPPGYDPAQFRVWGGSNIADPAHRRMVGLYHIVQGSTDGGYGVATWSEATGAWTPVPIANPTDASRPYVLWPAGQPAFATGVLLDGGFFYAYGCFTDFRCGLARVSASDPAAVANRSAWQFYSPATSSGCPAGTWSSTITCATPLPSAEVDLFGRPVGMLGGAAGMSVSWNAFLGRYLAVYTRPVSNDVLYSVAYRLEGPWSAPGLIASGTPGAVGVNYAGYAHTEFAEQNGKIQYVTYSRPLSTFSSRFGLLKVTFGTSPARYQRVATSEAYFADSAGTLRINAAGPTMLDTTGTQSSSTQTAVVDRQGTIYSPGAGVAGVSAVVHVDSQCCAGASATAGLVMRNSIPLAHNSIFTTAAQGYVTLVATPGAGVSLRWDSDGDQDLDRRLPATPNSVSGAVWLRLTRTDATTFEGAYSTDSPDGRTGTWTSIGSATAPTAATHQDVGIFTAGPDPTTLQRSVFSNFEILPRS